MSPRALKTVASAAAVAASLTGLLMAPALKDLVDRKPTGARGVVSLDGARRLCERTSLQGWELVDFATGLVHDKFTVYSCRNLWDTPALAFKYGMGYCTQYNLALGQLLRRLGFEVQPVFALRIESYRRPEWRMGHTWLRVTVDGETRDVCAGGAENKAGAVDFRPLTPVYNGYPPVLVLTHLGLIWYAGVLEWRSVLKRQPLPSWMYEQR
jgi:transglutaminase-like putative cysteine protease